jgi:putative aldouronate transport system substrate-binding protein
MKKSKIASLFICAGILLSACGNKENEGSTSGKESDERTSISWMTMLHTAAPPSGEVIEKLEDFTGMDIDFTWIPDASKTERLNAALASQSLADIVSLTEITNTTVRSSLASGMFWDVEPYLKDFPNLAAISEERLESSRIDGHIYGVPYQKLIARYGVLVRKDWLDNLGLEVPSTLEELEKVAQAFTEDDPDGNGVKDTVGFVEREESFNVGFRSLSGYFGADNLFSVTAENEVIPSFMQPEYKEAMEWFRNIYANGWMNSDFAVMAKNDQRNYIVQGKGGIVISGLQEVRNYVDDAVGTDEEHMEWALINDITYGDVERRILSDTNGGMGGWLAIPKENVKTEDDLKVVLKFINDLMDEEAFTLMTQGIEGVHYEVDDDGVYVRLDDTKWQQEVQPYASSRPSELVTVFPSSNPYVNLANEKISENEAYAVINPAQSLTSETYDKSWSSLLEGVSDAYYQYMTGEIEMDGFDAAVETFRKNGGDKIIEEFTADYQSKN